jgi:hypothetical protein
MPQSGSPWVTRQFVRLRDRISSLSTFFWIAAVTT